VSSIQQTVRDDPVGATIAVLLAALIVLLGAAIVLDRMPGQEDWRDYIFRPKVPPPPAEWRRKVRDDDVLDDVDGLDIAYWGRIDATYARRATDNKKPFEGIVFHYTEARPALQFIRYQHNGDDNRGGSFGYHFYCDRKGNAYQGAPLSVRTNHIKPTGHRQRKPVHRYWSSANTIGIGMVGGCWRDPYKRKAITASCDAEKLTTAQQRCGTLIAHALQARYGMDMGAVAGHGDLQHDRSEFEGSTLTAAIREEAAQVAANDKASKVAPAGLMSLGGP
jgi:hypothetical protein